MKRESWAKIDRTLRDVLEMDPGHRQTYLDRLDISAGSRAEVESLLSFESQTDDFMSLTAGEISRDFIPADKTDNTLVGQKVGIYEIKEELGIGGMGAVYLAERCDGNFDQLVAIKMLRREFNVERVRLSFEREKRILATLEHPNIARLLDAGTTGDGVPFLIMEYIDGIPIDKFCEQHRLPLAERLKLFNKACEAVSCAHHNLIVHSDLKPSNILVADDGTPKLLDFGISKLLKSAADNDPTLPNLSAMTPHYASPEQICGGPVTTATDIFSAGVILFKLLTGSFPFDTADKASGDLLAEITDSDPKLPSDAALRNRPDTNRSVKPSDAASPAPGVAGPELRGDLDNIILKSLRKDPARRYQSMEQLSDDIWRFLDGQPVLARPATLSYRASKFYRRNKIAVIAGIVVLVSLIVGTTVAIWQAGVAQAHSLAAAESQHLAEVEAERARTEAANANVEREKAQKISKFMAQIISYANPGWYAKGAKTKGEAKIIDILDEMGGQIDKEFAGEADIQAELHHQFAEVYTMIKSPGINSPRAQIAKSKREFHARRALELRKQFYGDYNELVAMDLFYFVADNSLDAKTSAETLAYAIQMMRDTNPHNLNLPYMLSAYAKRLASQDTESVHEIYLRAARPQTGESKYELAEKYLKQALPIYREHYEEDNRAIVSDECMLAFILYKQGKSDEAGQYYEACKSIETLLGAEAARPHLEPIEKILAAK